MRVENIVLQYCIMGVWKTCQSVREGVSDDI